MGKVKKNLKKIIQKTSNHFWYRKKKTKMINLGWEPIKQIIT